MRYYAEMLGTFLLVFAGCGAIVADQLTGGGLGTTGIGLVFGAVIAVLVFILGPISGAHFNPAVTVMFMSVRRINLKDAAGYVFFQILGAYLAAVLLMLIIPGLTDPGVTRPIAVEGNSLWIAAFIFELVMSFLLGFVILRVVVGAELPPALGSLFIGSTVGLEAIFGGPFSGASMNPARSLGPALASLDMNYIWLYILAPVVAMVIAGLLARPMLGLKDPVEN